MRKRRSPSWRAWSGNSFEGICLKHVEGIKQALGIAGVDTFQTGWRHQPTVEVPDGAQIDLVIDRADMSINLCEMKFSEAPFVISKRYAEQLRHKRATFQRVTKTRKSLFLTLVSTFGVADNAYARELGVQSVTMDALFNESHPS